MISIKLFKVVAKIGNLSLFSGATAVQSRPKSHTFTINFGVFALQTKNPWKGLFYTALCYCTTTCTQCVPIFCVCVSSLVSFFGEERSHNIEQVIGERRNG